MDATTRVVAFIGLNMPDVAGFALAAKFRRRPGLRQARLVALTGDASRADHDAALSAGFDHHLSKPVDMQALAAILASAGQT
ncbi:response regulator [Paraburkholderia sp. SIMBA_030]|uniref:response regulator n=1 Tax=Paraburkholderia sp. SIMBA_030 TaxID=3085773 RepID=UPI0039786422